MKVGIALAIAAVGFGADEIERLCIDGALA